MEEKIKLSDPVALTQDLPDDNLIRGQVGTVVEILGPDVFEVEFSDNEGRTYASVSARSEQLMVLHDRPVKVA